MVINVILIGAEVKCGTFTDKQTKKEVSYDNLYLYFQSFEELDNPENENFAFGRSTASYKVKNETENLQKIFKGLYKDDQGEWLKSLVGTDFEIIENRYGGLQRVLLN